MTSSPDTIELRADELLSQFDPDSRLDRYFDLLVEENQRINLVSRETSRSGLVQLAAESLLPFRLLENRAYPRYLDIGSGGGFPSFPILLTQSVGQATLLERTQKKASVLERFSRDKALGLAGKVEVVSRTFEEWKADGVFDLITLRLVRLTPDLLKKILHRLAPDGLFIYYATPESAKSAKALRIDSYRYVVGQSDVIKSFTLIRKK